MNKNSSSEFGFNTPGNAMKWDTTEPTQDVFSFTHADYEVQWAKNHSQVVRGHNFSKLMILYPSHSIPEG